MGDNDLFEFMRDATEKMAKEYDRIQKRATEDPGTAGDQGEENWATLLRSWLPTTFQIVTKGRILSHEGVASPQIDVLVLRPEYPSALLDKKLYLAAGVLAAFECKITLKSSHVEEFFETSRKVQSCVKRKMGSPYKEIQSPLIYGLLAHSHDWKKDPIETLNSKILKYDEKIIEHPFEMPDIICVADLASWSSSKTAFMASFMFPGSDHLKEHFGEEGCASTAYVGHGREIQNMEYEFSPIGHLITSLMHKIAWQHPNLRELANYFRLTNIQGHGSGETRKWEGEIYTEDTLKKIKRGAIKNGNLWDEWNIGIM